MQLLGADTLAAPERVVLRTGRLLREDFLQQSAFDEQDAYCDPRKQLAMLRAIRAADAAMSVGGGPRRVRRGRRPPHRRSPRSRGCASGRRAKRRSSAEALIERIERELEQI